MDIYDAAALQRPTSFALNLTRLPTELVHQVIQELPLIKILQILAHKEPHLNRCIISHNSWRRLFRRQADIDLVIDVFILYREICRFTNAPLVTANTLLALGGISPRFDVEVGATHLKIYLEEAIRAALPRGEREMAMLETHASTPYPGHDADVFTRWAWVKTSKFALNRAKSQQLTLCATLMSQHPEKLMLKKPLDPLQGAPRKNLKHVEDQLRHFAKLALHNHRLVFRDWNADYGCKVAIDNIELVPHDRYLWFFMDTLEKYPFPDEDVYDDAAIDVVPRGLPAEKKPGYTYPPEITALIAVILKGLSFVYTGHPLLVVPRIRWEGRRLATGPDATKPAFEHLFENHSHDLPKAFHRCGVNLVMTYDKREYEWLRAFLTVVTWMEKEFGGLEYPVALDEKDAQVVAGT